MQLKKLHLVILGKAALTVAAIYASGGGFSPEGFSMFGSAGSTAGGLLGSGGQFGLGQSYLGQGLFGVPTDYYGLSGGSKGFLGNLGITSGFGADLLPKGISSLHYQVQVDFISYIFRRHCVRRSFIRRTYQQRSDGISDEAHQAAVD